MTDRFELYYSKSKREYFIRDTLGEIKCFGCANLEVADYICKEWNKLYNENQELKKVLQDIGLLKSDEEVLQIREAIADKIMKPLFENGGFDVDIDCRDGFTITPKDDPDVKWLRENTVWEQMPTNKKTYTTTHMEDKE